MCEITAKMVERGVAQGLEQGRRETYYNLVQDGELSIEYVANKLEKAIEEVE